MLQYSLAIDTVNAKINKVQTINVYSFMSEGGEHRCPRFFKGKTIFKKTAAPPVTPQTIRQFL